MDYEYEKTAGDAIDYVTELIAKRLKAENKRTGHLNLYLTEVSDQQGKYVHPNNKEKESALKYLESEKVIKIINITFSNTGTHRKICLIQVNKSFWNIFSSGLAKHEKIYKCGKLTLDLNRGEITFKDKRTIHISPQTREIKLLALLMNIPGNIVENRMIGKALDLNIYTEGDLNNKDGLKREIQSIKRDLRKILIEAGMTEKQIENSIRSVTKVGYKMLC